MPEMAAAGKKHGNARGIACINHLLIPNTSPRLHDEPDSKIIGGINTVTEGEKSIGNQYRFLYFHILFQ